MGRATNPTFSSFSSTFPGRPIDLLRPKETGDLGTVSGRAREARRSFATAPGSSVKSGMGRALKLLPISSTSPLLLPSLAGDQRWNGSATVLSRDFTCGTPDEPHPSNTARFKGRALNWCSSISSSAFSSVV